MLIHPLRQHTTMHAHRALMILCTAALLWYPSLAGAQTLVYHSPNDDGLPAAGGASVPEGTGQSVYLYLDGGVTASAPGTTCDTGTGNEVCGFDLHLTGLLGVVVTGFTADVGADLVTNLSAGQILINGLDSQSPTPGAVRIGELVVDTVAGGSLELTSGEVIGADLTSEALTAGTLVSVPEPGLSMLLLSGAALLAFLEPRRATR